MAIEETEGTWYEKQCVLSSKSYADRFLRATDF